MKSRLLVALRWVGLLLLAGLVLQLFFAGRIAVMRVINPESTAFERSAAVQIFRKNGALAGWSQSWLPYAALPSHLKRAVIASEDASFALHDGIDMEALEKAWERNEKANEKAEKAAEANANSQTVKPMGVRPPKIVGGSTITQQLAKNLFLSGERTLLRKAQELLIAKQLEWLLSKERILEIYLNSAEWGTGIFGAEAAAQHYFRKPAAQLSAYESARLAVMLPRPQFFQLKPHSSYLQARANTIVRRMAQVELP